MTYVPLHLHSQYSILDSTLSIKNIVDKAKEYGISHLALTDFCNMYGAIDFYKGCKGEGITPIIGCEVMVAPGKRGEKKKVGLGPAGYPLILLAKNQTGYRNLCKLTSSGFTEGFYYYPRIDKEILTEHKEGLICLSGPFYGKIAALITAGDEKGLLKEVEEFQSLFGEDFYFEVARHKGLSEISAGESWLTQKLLDAVEKEEKILQRLKSLGQEKGIRCVATNDIRYLAKEDWQAHEILMNVSSGEPCEIWEKDSFGNLKQRIPNPKRQTAYSQELYFKSPSEMSDLFSDFPEAISNTVEVAKSCDLKFDFSQKFYPVFVPPHLEGKEISTEERVKEAALYLENLCEEGIGKRYSAEALEEVAKKYPEKEPLDVVRSRLAYELQLIVSKGMCDYLLIVHDFIAWAKGKNIPVGPGRGSGAGSIILYLIGITDIEPLRFNLFFERFINPERISYPDIDVDICMERRPEVIDYTIRKYGKDRVAQIITFGTMKAKMAIKDVGRVLSIPLAKVNEIAKLVPEDLGITISKALEIDPDLKRMYDTDEDTKLVLDIAQKVEGSIRNTGIHAAGLIICGDPLTDHIPVCTSKDTEVLVTQYSMKPVELVGMLKIDFLGLKTLTSIQKAVEALREHKGKEIHWAELPLDDKKTFDLLNQGKTSGIFQLESSGMQDLARQLHIDKFEEIIAVGALYRPGPMEMIPSFIARKHGREKIEYDHEWLQDILQETYGIMVYQEQVMQLASKLAGYSLGEGDVLRRAMGKKDKEEMRRQGAKFTEGAVQKGIDEKVAMAIFEKVEKFASYGFNKSHAAAYGYLSYVTAYLKANYPGEWMAALMTCDMADLSKVAKHIRECQSMHMQILPPDVNESEGTFVATESGVRFALAAIKGIGEGVVKGIVEERKKGGNFASLHHFLTRLDTSVCGKKVIESLIESGSFDFTKWSRKELLGYLEINFDAILKKKKDESKGILDLFAGSAEESIEIPPKIEEEENDKMERLKKEKELLGFYVTGHPLLEYKEWIEKLECVPMDQLEKCKDRAIVKCAFVVDTLQVRISARSQKKFAILTVSDGFERFELPVWPELFEKQSHLLEDNAVLVGIIQIDAKDEGLRLSAKELFDLTKIDQKGVEEIIKAAAEGEKKTASFEKRKKEAVVSATKTLKFKIDIDKIEMSQILQLKRFFLSAPGGDGIDVLFHGNGELVGSLSIDPATGIKGSEEMVAQLKSLPYTIDLILEE